MIVKSFVFSCGMFYMPYIPCWLNYLYYVANSSFVHGYLYVTLYVVSIFLVKTYFLTCITLVFYLFCILYHCISTLALIVINLYYSYITSLPNIVPCRTD